MSNYTPDNIIIFGAVALMLLCSAPLTPLLFFIAGVVLLLGILLDIASMWKR